MPGAMSAETKNTFLSISSSHLIFLRLASFLPLRSKSFSHPLSLLLQLWDHWSVLAGNMMWSGYGIRMTLRGEMEIDFICEDIIMVGFTMRYILLATKRKKLCHLVESCEKLWDYLEIGEDALVRQFERRGYYYRNFMMLNLLLMCTLYIVTAHFATLPPLEANGTERRMLPFKFFMDVQEEPAYSIAFVSQSVVTYFICFMFVSTETVPLYLILMACGYLRSVRDRLLSIEGSDDDTSERGEVAFKFVAGCAHFHQQIMIFCEDIKHTMRTIFLFACFCPIYNLSITGIKLLENDEDKFKFIVILVYNFFQFFLCQWAPEYLIEESEDIAAAAYSASLQPQALSHREKINGILYFMMMRAQKPMQLTAGGFVRLSVETFGAMTKNAFSFFMVLRNFSS
ncbi:odorant receptor 224 [Nasonia vitripennis]|uniref:Odorant receptor n=1 Tax=Nasonia vitripennis TaxID=7425 RepID=A0A7M6UMS4_NASVI|nr:odorant receptor 224 [Nasonia vitripennis]